MRVALVVAVVALCVASVAATDLEDEGVFDIGKKAVDGVTGTYGQAQTKLMEKAGSLVGMNFTNLAGLNGKQVIKIVSPLVAKMYEPLEKKGLKFSVGFILKEPQFIIGSAVDGSAKPKPLVTTIISLTAKWDPNGDHSKLIQFANKHAMFPPCAIVVVALDSKSSESSPKASKAASKTPKPSKKKSMLLELQDQISSLDTKPKGKASKGKPSKGAKAGKGSKGSKGGSKGSKYGKQFTTFAGTKTLKGLTIPNVFVISSSFDLLASGDLNKPWTNINAKGVTTALGGAVDGVGGGAKGGKGAKGGAGGVGGLGGALGGLGGI